MQLTLSSLLLRGVGMAYRVVLQGRIGAEGMGLYQLIMTIYGLFSMVSCAGLTITVSRLCAERPMAQRSIVCKSCGYAAVLGGTLGLLLYFSADFIAGSLLKDLRACAALRWIAPSLPMMGISAALRGYFIARGDVLRPTVAQVAEQLARVTLVLAALELLAVTDLTQACGIILFGATAAELFSVLLHIAFLHAHPLHTMQVIPLHEVLGGIMPILFGCAVQSGLQTAENLLIPLLLEAGGASVSAALSQYGMLGGMVLPVLLFPTALPAAFGTLLLPEIAKARSAGHIHRVQQLSLCSLRLTLLMSIGFCALFLLCGKGLMQLLYRSDAACGMLMLLSPLLPLVYLDGLCDALLKGLGKQTATMVVETADGVLRVMGIALLLPRLGMAGYIAVLYLSGFCCCIARLALLMRAAGLENSTMLKMLLFTKKKTCTA